MSKPAGQRDLATLVEEARNCQACDLYKTATQTVFGEGPADAELVLVGEQPGDQEDKSGHPFIGPAGHLLDRALEAAGIDRGRAYVTNVVKHFKWEPRGKRRIHKSPNQSEIKACRPWLDDELLALAPKAVVLLGATAAKAILGRDFRVTEDRGKLLDSDLAKVVMATVHPSALIRIPDAASRQREIDRFVDELKVLKKAMHA